MAKRERPLSPAYAKRVASALRRGKTLQAARGHKPREHVQRAERERAELGITRGEISRVRQWASRRAVATHDESFDPEVVVQEAMSNGYEWFISYRDTWNEARRNYLRQERNGTYASLGIGHLEYLANIPPVQDLSWMYYH